MTRPISAKAAEMFSVAVHLMISGFRGVTTYQVIVPNQCVVSAESLSEGTTQLAVAFNTLEFEPTAEGASLKLTVQIASFAGPGMVKGYESGNRSAIESLSRHLASNP
ncbi:MAG: hypothetical protein JO099_14705 [Acidobacteriia bacterium]|nr:hypothetical protein [Terriglobia bacterium]